MAIAAKRCKAQLYFTLPPIKVLCIKNNTYIIYNNTFSFLFNHLPGGVPRAYKY
jgi:hypothetical protein